MGILAGFVTQSSRWSNPVLPETNAKFFISFSAQAARAAPFAFGGSSMPGRQFVADESKGPEEHRNVRRWVHAVIKRGQKS